MKLLLGLLIIIAFTSCGQDEETDKGGGTCQLTNSTDVVACIAIETDVESTDSADLCTSIDTADSTNIDGHTFSSTSGNCPITNTLGTCSISDGIAYYYSNGTIFNAGTAATHCAASPQSGTWTAAK